jgi:hypothetical protein
MNERGRLRLSVIAGITGAFLLGSVITVLTIVEQDFMISIGWRLDAPLDWPSGLALGPYGWIMTAAFLICGLLIIVFASGLCLRLPRHWLTTVSTWLLIAAGYGLIGLISPTDKTLDKELHGMPATWHGRLHDSSFVVIGITLMPAMLLLGYLFLKDERWKDLALYTWITVALVVPTFWMKGFAFYIFLLAILVWCEVIAFRLKRLTEN